MERKGCCCQGNREQQADSARRVTLRCQTNLVLSVRSDILPGGEMERQRRVASGKWPCSRLMPIVLAGRSLAAYCGVLPRAKHRGLLLVLAGRSLAANRRNRIAILLVHVGRSLATSCWCFLGAPDLRPVSSVCGRRNKAIALRRCEPHLPSADRGSGVERSAKLASPARARAEQCRYLPRTFSWKRRLCEAWTAVLRRDSGVANFFSSAKRPSFLFMPDPRALKPLENLDGWIAQETFDEDGSSNVRARVAQAPPGMT